MDDQPYGADWRAEVDQMIAECPDAEHLAAVQPGIAIEVGSVGPCRDELVPGGIVHHQEPFCTPGRVAAAITGAGAMAQPTACLTPVQREAAWQKWHSTGRPSEMLVEVTTGKGWTMETIREAFMAGLDAKP